MTDIYPQFRISSDSYLAFADNAQFLYDLACTLKDTPHKMGPSYDKLIKAISTQSPLAIITARGQDPRVLAYGLKMLIAARMDDFSLAKGSTTINLDYDKQYYENLVKEILSSPGLLLSRAHFPFFPQSLMEYLDAQYFYCISNDNFKREYFTSKGKTYVY